ncbi:hypothetical protein D3C73_1086320 [compost metagenome]
MTAVAASVLHVIRLRFLISCRLLGVLLPATCCRTGMVISACGLLVLRFAACGQYAKSKYRCSDEDDFLLHGSYNSVSL